MSTPLIVLAAILAILAFILIPLMMYKGGQQNQDRHAQGNMGKKQSKKKKKR